MSENMSIELPEENGVIVDLSEYEVIVSTSGGKDSTAAILALREAGIDARYVFADTRWEAPETYAYLDLLRERLGLTIDVVGYPGGMQAKILEGARFPGRKQRWCTRELKIEPLRAYHDDVIEATGQETISVLGIRGQESDSRAKMAVWEDEPEGNRSWGGYIWRPLLAWTVEDVIAIHVRHGVPLNPLYYNGHGRVGCYPCIFASKPEIRAIAERRPERVDLIERLEQQVSAERRRRNEVQPGRYKHPDAEFFQTQRNGFTGIRNVVKWSNTAYGGKQYPLFAEPPAGLCMQAGLCEGLPKHAIELPERFAAPKGQTWRDILIDLAMDAGAQLADVAAILERDAPDVHALLGRRIDQYPDPMRAVVDVAIADAICTAGDEIGLAVGG